MQLNNKTISRVYLINKHTGYVITDSTVYCCDNCVLFVPNNFCIQNLPGLLVADLFLTPLFLHTSFAM